MYTIFDLAALFGVSVETVSAQVSTRPFIGVGDARRVSHVTAAAIATALSKSL